MRFGLGMCCAHLEDVVEGGRGVAGFERRVQRRELVPAQHETKRTDTDAPSHARAYRMQPSDHTSLLKS
jgi:hypothetical protein